MMANAIEVKTKDLSGISLDWATAIAINNPAYQAVNGSIYSSNERWDIDVDYPHPRTQAIWRPSTDWSQGGALMDRLIGMKIQNGRTIHNVTLERLEHWYDSTPGLCREWRMELGHDTGRYEGRGETPLMAVCRAIVMAKVGPVIAVPASIMKSMEIER